MHSLLAVGLLSLVQAESGGEPTSPPAATALAAPASRPSPPASTPTGSSNVELAQKLANPVSDLISVPFQLNYDCCYGPEDGARYTLNIQPVIPVHINDDWKMIVRTIIPIIDQEPTTTTSGDHFGLGDITQTFFFSPKSAGGLTWAVGPVFYWPTGTDSLGSGKWGAGPSGLVLKQAGGTTYGIMANHIWSYAGSEGREDISATLLQPFISHTWPSTTGVSLNLEASYDWKGEEWSVPMNVGVSHIYSVGKQKVQLALQGKVYLASPDNGPDWGLRFVATFLIPE